MAEIQLEIVSGLKIGKLLVTFIADIQNIMYEYCNLTMNSCIVAISFSKKVDVIGAKLDISSSGQFLSSFKFQVCADCLSRLSLIAF